MPTPNLIGFKKFFFEYGTGSVTRPDQQAFGHGKDGTLDSLSTQAMELGISEPSMISVPWAGSNIQIGREIMSGNTSITPLKITDKTATLKIRDNGSKRFIKTPGGLYNNPNPAGKEKIITVTRAEFVKMCDNQYGGGSGAVASGSMGGGLPPMM